MQIRQTGEDRRNQTALDSFADCCLINRPYPRILAIKFGGVIQRAQFGTNEEICSSPLADSRTSVNWRAPCT